MKTWLPLAVCAAWAIFHAGRAAADEALEENDRLRSLVAGGRPGEDSRLMLGGWLEQGFTWNPDSPVDRFNGYVTNNDRANEYQLNQMFLASGAKAADEGDEISLGARANLLYGTDAYFFQALGLDDRIVSDDASRFYKLALPQLYAEAYLPIGNGLTILAGKWSSPLGFEYGLGSRDFFYSRNIAFNFTPYSHTGVTATYRVADEWTVMQGVHRGADVWEDNNNDLSYIGSTTWTSPSEAWEIYFAVTVGPEQDERADWQDLDGAPGPDAPGKNFVQAITTTAATVRVTDALEATITQDYFFQEGDPDGVVGQAEAYGGTLYLVRSIDDLLSAGFRLEVMRDDDGFVTEGLRSGSPGAAGLYTNLSVGLNRRFGKASVVRPEIRWDWQHRDDPADPAAFDGWTASQQILLGCDVVSHF